MNEYDKGIIKALMTKKGFIYTEKNYEIIIYLTCAVREHAVKRLKGNLRSEKKYVRVVAGCLSEMLKENLIKEKLAEIVVSPTAYKVLPEKIEDFLKTHENLFISGENYESYEDIIPEVKGKSSYITIMRGCNNFCSYCIVPYVRGKERYKSYKSIRKEAMALVENGIEEIFLIGQNVLAYRWEDFDFISLLEEISLLPNLLRIGFLTSHPFDLTRNIIKRMSNIKKLIRYMHLPFQSGSNRILKAMRRKYSIEEYLDKIYFLKEIMPDAYISTDIIVGFPGEEESDFEKTIDVVKKVRFDSAYMFIYSDRPFTTSRLMKNKIPYEVAHKRFETLLALQNKITKEKAFETVQNKPIEIFPFKKKGDMFLGKMWNNRIVAFSGQVNEKGLTPVILKEVRGWTPSGYSIINKEENK